jgi:hypothetical protein
MLMDYSERDNVHLIINPQNIYVNPAWNQIMDFALVNKYERCCIMNSDLVLHPDWLKVLNKVEKENPMTVPCPTWCHVEKFNEADTKNIQLINVDGGIPGVFLVLDQTLLEFVFPIPETLKIWFGDNWIFDLARQLGYQQCLVKGLYAHHYISQNVSRVTEAPEIIEQDKIQWNLISQKSNPYITM